MEDPSHGILVLTLAKVEPYARRIRFVLWSGWIGMPLIFSLVLLMLYLRGFPSDLLTIMAVIIYPLPVLDYFLMDHILGRNIRPVQVYTDGIQFPVSTIYRMIKRSQFVRRSDVEEISSPSPVVPDRSRPSIQSSSSSFRLRTRYGRTFISGPRDAKEVQMALDYFAREWKIQVKHAAVVT